MSFDDGEKLKDINRQLISHISVLQYKVNLDSRQQQSTIDDLLDTSKKRLSEKNSKIEELKGDRRVKEEHVKRLKEENERKNQEVNRLTQYVSDLQKDVSSSKNYADEIQRQLDNLTTAQQERGHVQIDKDKHILELRAEIETMKKHMATLEKELSLANEKIAQQGSKIRLLEIDRDVTDVKLKESVARATRVLRNEIEKVRDVMIRQWKEMRELYKQNNEMRETVREMTDFMVTFKESITRQNASVNGMQLPQIDNSKEKQMHGKRKT